MKLTFKKIRKGRYKASIHRFNGGISTLIRGREGNLMFVIAVFFMFKEYIRCWKWERKYPQSI